VGREGLEPSTNGLKVRCSNQLSYRPAKPSIVLKQPPTVKLQNAPNATLAIGFRASPRR